jgi:drug/metabolite transporter (DMT)-like permease
MLVPVVAFILLAIIWGSNFIYMKMASELITPMQIVFFRVLFGFFPILFYGLVRRELDFNHYRYVHHFVVMALLATIIQYYGFAKGTTFLLSGVAGAVTGAIPIFSFILALLFIPEEKASALKVLGIILGFAGVLVIAAPNEEQLVSSNTVGVLYIVMGSLGLGSSFIYARKYIIPLKLPSVALATYQLGFGMVILALLTDYSGMTGIMADLPAALALIVGLGLLGTGFAFIIYYYIVRHLGAVAASTVTYLSPVVAMLIGTLLVGEPIGKAEYLATAMILVGVILSKGKSLKVALR